MNECTYSTSHFVHREKSNEGIAGWLTVDFDGKLASSSLIHTMQKFLRFPVSVFFFGICRQRRVPTSSLQFLHIILCLATRLWQRSTNNNKGSEREKKNRWVPLKKSGWNSNTRRNRECLYIGKWVDLVCIALFDLICTSSTSTRPYAIVHRYQLFPLPSLVPWSCWWHPEPHCSSIIMLT